MLKIYILKYIAQQNLAKDDSLGLKNMSEDGRLLLETSYVHVTSLSKTNRAC